MQFNQVVLYTGEDGRARFREQAIALPEGTPQARLSALMPSGGLQLLVAMVCLVVALYFRTAHYWVYVTFLTPTVVLLSASGDVTATGESRVLYTVIAASQVVLASAIVFAYQHRRSQGESSSKPIRQEPIVDPAVTE